MTMDVLILLAALVFVVIMTVARVKVGGRKVYAVMWRSGSRWVRAYPNPGIKVSRKLQWSKTYGWGER